MTLRSHQVDIYGAWLHCTTDRRAWGQLRRRFDDLPKPDGIGYTTQISRPDATHFCVFIDMGLLADNDIGMVEIISHEATHVGTMLLDHIGQKYDGESEALAYLVAWTAAWCWETCSP